MKRKLLIYYIFQSLVCTAIAQYNTATGTGALNSVTTGQANTATGYNSLYYMMGPWNNSAHGYYSLYNNNFGGDNSAYGSNSLASAYSGEGNAAMGYRSLYSNTFGSRNTAIGTNSLKLNYTGEYNTAMGETGLNSNYSGHYNTAAGSAAGWINTTGHYNTYVGYNTDNATTNQNYNNTTLIGARTHLINADTSNKIKVGNNAGLIWGGGINFTVFSDRRIKRNIKEDVPGLTFIKLLRPVTYRLDMPAYISLTQTPDSENTRGTLFASGDSEAIRSGLDNMAKKTYTGFIAQEVELAARSLKYSFSGVQAPKSTEGLYSVNYDQFIVPLVKAIQELNAINNGLKVQVNELKGGLNTLLEKIDDLKSDKNISK